MPSTANDRFNRLTGVIRDAFPHATMDQVENLANGIIDNTVNDPEARRIAAEVMTASGINPRRTSVVVVLTAILALTALGVSGWHYTSVSSLDAPQIDAIVNKHAVMSRVADIEGAGYATTAQVDEKIAAIPMPQISVEMRFAEDYLNRLDQDGDGVPGAADICPDIAGVRQEVGNGCPASSDDDGDGIDNAFDHCPATPEADKAKVVNDLTGYVWIYAADVAALPDNGCTDGNGDGYADARIAALTTLCSAVNPTETKPASEGVPDEGKAFYTGCTVDEYSDQDITCSYVGEVVNDCRVAIKG